MILDSKLIYENYLQFVFSRVSKTIAVLRKLQFTLPRKSPVIIYKSFVRPHLDYVDEFYDGTSNESSHQSHESLYNHPKIKTLAEKIIPTL